MSRTKLLVASLAVASAIAARLVANFALRDVAHVMDEITYLFQAKLYAQGHVLAPVAEPRAAFNMWFVDDRAARYGIFPPGWPAVLALGLRLGLERWVNPLLHGATVFLVYVAGRRLASERVGVLASIIYAASPQALLLAASLMSHTVVAACAGVVVVACAAAVKGDAPSRPLAISAGAALGLVAATRPVCAVVLGITVVLAVALGRAERRAALATLALVAAGAAPFVVALLAYNHAVTGGALRFPQGVYFDEHLAPANVPFFRYHKGCNDLGFGPGHGCDFTISDATHTVGNALSNLADNTKAWLLLVCGPLLPVGAVLAFVRRPSRKVAGLLLATPLASFALYSLYWHGGTCFGARFYQAALPSAVLLVAVGVASVATSPRVVAALVATALLWDGYAMTKSLGEIGDPNWGYWAVDDRFHELATHWAHGRAVVMVAFGRDDLRNGELGWTAVVPNGTPWMLNIRAQGALAENPPRVGDAEVVFAKFHPALVDELRQHFPGRSLWLYVLTAKRESDTLAPYDASAFAGRGTRHPPDNFDGFRVAPPIDEPLPIFQATDPDD